MDQKLSAKAPTFSPTDSSTNGSLSASAVCFEPVASTLPLPSTISTRSHGSGSYLETTSLTVLGGTGNSTPWTQHEQTMFEQAMRSVPASTSQRWSKIANLVPGRSAKACLQRAKQLQAEAISKKKASQPSNTQPTPQPPGKQSGPSEHALESTTLQSQPTNLSGNRSGTRTSSNDKRKTESDRSSHPQPPSSNKLLSVGTQQCDRELDGSNESNKQAGIPSDRRNRSSTARSAQSVGTAKGKKPIGAKKNRSESRGNDDSQKSESRKNRNVTKVDGAVNEESVASPAHGKSKRNPRRDNGLQARTREGRVRGTGRDGRTQQPDIRILARGQQARDLDQEPLDSKRAKSRKKTSRTENGGSGSNAPMAEPQRETAPTPQVTANSEAPTATKPTRRKRVSRPSLSVDANLAEIMTKQLIAQTYECMVCYEAVKRQQKIWSCSVCYRAFHTKCIHKWSSFASKDSSESDNAGWRCPGCQTLNKRRPTQYRCFCGKRRDPTWTPHGPPPHTCGDVCAQPLPLCDHVCTEPCHPGPCRACPVMVQRSCHCGKSVVTVRCSSEVGTRAARLQHSLSVCGGRAVWDHPWTLLGIAQLQGWLPCAHLCWYDGRVSEAPSRSTAHHARRYRPLCSAHFLLCIALFRYALGACIGVYTHGMTRL
eukprot:m.1151206 g.1151206  ORF g.1151206 m.1151206 type:complete len:655 (+) comp24480_c1_seq9:236-2200(+)